MFEQIRFHTSVANPSHLPSGTVEVAFAGRSNSGKSSAINTLTARRKLAHVSKTPGRTRLLNYFEVTPGRFLVDLPGYGFAKVSKDTRAEWDRLIGAYFSGRPELHGLVITSDVRHALGELDCSLLGFVAPIGTPVLVLLTKSDKLARSAAVEALRRVRRQLEGVCPAAQAQLFSSLKRSGVREAREWVSRHLGIEDEKNPRLKGSKTGGEALTVIKAPAQGGEAGDGASTICGL